MTITKLKTKRERNNITHESTMTIYKNIIQNKNLFMYVKMRKLKTLQKHVNFPVNELEEN